MSGRLSNGAERDHGTRYHALSLHNGRGDYQKDPAICRSKPGKRSVGWSPYHGKEVTCPRCIDRLQKIERRAKIAVESDLRRLEYLEKSRGAEYMKEYSHPAKEYPQPIAGEYELDALEGLKDSDGATYTGGFYVEDGVIWYRVTLNLQEYETSEDPNDESILDQIHSMTRGES